ncbi:MAG: hypothetical protein COY66_05470 [Candidatus Kerfeldbacteria bacterium CG_4_10_14_0_8_um_filter_42_10]|uniref:Polysaccharide chain length determinant N-terminal domain-containing protein n=1 Tax=Candidatus Kerfeldbacteria bacterium CG_4_10_14_0_8_um_filter_42_10 TaxID=2014248 RepID=A0A2M7RHV9_9BACT|nr:MAG: hypothetical protein COY66_05470 [Candidatus Kerfeldbacteria bacterium CG_4_10_14_0_8_um_filter_42_10]
MEKSKTTYLSIFRLGKRTLVIFAAIGFALALVVSIIQPLQYRSQASILVIPNNRANVDGYQASRAAEKYALTLSSVIPTMSFYNKVITQNSSLADLFPTEESAKREQWKNDLHSSVVPETGILNLSAYNRKPEDAQNILAAAINVLEKEGTAYLGGSSSALIYMIDTPIASSLPVRPNYPLNILGGIIAGLLAGAVVVFVRSESYPEEVQEVEPEAIALETEKIEEEQSGLEEPDEFELVPPQSNPLESIPRSQEQDSLREEKKWYPESENSENQEQTAEAASYLGQFDPWVTLKHKRN